MNKKWICMFDLAYHGLLIGVSYYYFVVTVTDRVESLLAKHFVALVLHFGGCNWGGRFSR